MNQPATYFDTRFVKFLDELSSKASRAWLDKHRDRFEAEVKIPFTRFVEEMIRRISEFEPVDNKSSHAISIVENKAALSGGRKFFGVHMSAHISRTGKKDLSWPAFVFSFSHEIIEIRGGSMELDVMQVEKVRKAIMEWHPDFVAAYNDQLFKEKFGAIEGETSTDLPAPFSEMLAVEPMIAKQQFFYRAQLIPEILFIDNLPAVLMDFYTAGKKVNDFLKKALSF